MRTAALWITGVLIMSVQAHSSVMKAALARDGKCVLADMPIPNPGTQEVLVRIYASAVNRADTLQRNGAYPPPAGASEVLGLEMAGVVERLGPDCRSGTRVGDRVMALLSGGGANALPSNAEYVVVHEGLLLPVPASVSVAQAGGLPEVWLTAFQLLHKVARVRRGDTVLVHAAGSGVGTAAIQVAAAAGARVFATAGREDKLATARELGAELAINYKEADFVDAVTAATQGAGVDIVLDCVGGQYWQQNARALAMDGRWVLYGLLGGPHVDGPLLASLLRKRIRLEATTLRARSLAYKVDLVQHMWAELGSKFEAGELRIIVDREFALQELQAAHEYMESNASVGKILIRVRDEGKAAVGEGKEEL